MFYDTLRLMVWDKRKTITFIHFSTRDLTSNKNKKSKKKKKSLNVTFI